MAWGKRGRGSLGFVSRKRYRASSSGANASAVTKVQRKAPTAQNQKSQIMSLSKRVTTLNKIVRPMVARVTWEAKAATGGDIPIPGNAPVPYDIAVPTNWIRQFQESNGSTNAGEDVRECQVTSFKLLVTLEALSDSKRDYISFFCFSLKKAAKTRWPKGYIDVTANGAMTENQDYAITGEQVTLNPQIYKVHKKACFPMGVYTTPAMPTGMTDFANLQSKPEHVKKQLSFYIDHKKKYKNIQGDNWKELHVSEMPMENHVYVMAFSGRGDAENPTKSFKAFALITTASADS